MKIAWFCIPAHGHTNPTLGLVEEMTRAGHEVRYFSFAMFREKIEKAGATFVPCDDYDLGDGERDAGDRVGKDIAYSTELIVRATLALDPLLTRELGAWRPDLIVSDSVAFWGKLAALKFGIPYVCSTTTFAFNRYSSKYMPQSAGSMIKMLFAMPRVSRALGRLRAAGYPVKSVFDIIANDNDTNTVVYTSKAFQPCAKTFSERYRFIGPSVRPAMEKTEKTAGKTVYISLGTVVSNERLLKNAIEAVRGTDWQVLVSTGETEVAPADVPENVRLYRSVDQMSVLGIADVFLTHCGMNSVSEALWSGVPLVLAPQTPEQGAVARRTAEVGAGQLLRNTDPEAIRCALETVLGQTSYKNAAKAMARSLHACGGVREGREFLEKCAAAGYNKA
ncbi:MAG: glucosyltransferase [Clostridia bacterium]|nr:glucosyltransferase [Clostridia bacterium]